MESRINSSKRAITSEEIKIVMKYVPAISLWGFLLVLYQFYQHLLKFLKNTTGTLKGNALNLYDTVGIMVI